MKSIRTFIFIEKNGDAVITLSAYDFEDALETLIGIVRNADDFYAENEDGESEDDEESIFSKNFYK